MLNNITELLPCGNDTKYDNIYLDIENEIDKENSLIHTNQIDWYKVQQNCEELLITKTKDIKLLCWWAIAKLKLDGLEQSINILNIVNSFLTHFNENLFPNSHKIRYTMFVWLETNFEKMAIKENKLMFNFDEMINLLELLENIQNNISSLTLSKQLFFKNTINLIKEIRQNKISQIQTTKTIHKTQSNNTSIIESITTEQEATKALNQIKKLSNELINFLRTKNYADIKAIKLVRTLSWLEIEQLPDTKNNKTLLKAPTNDRIEQIDKLINEKKYDLAFDLIETTLIRSPFWFDGHKKAFEILKAENQTQAIKELKNMLSYFINTHDGILDLEFQDSTPFASEEVKKWLQESKDEVKSTNKKEYLPDELNTLRNNCFNQIKQKNTKEAFVMIENSYNQAQNHEQKFIYRLLHAELSIEASLPQLALAIIEELYDDIKKFNLEKWKPDLASKVYYLLLKSFNRTQITKEKFDDAYYRLSKINSSLILDIKF